MGAHPSSNSIQTSRRTASELTVSCAWRVALAGIALLSCLGGCATSRVEQLSANSYDIDCSGGAPSWGRCLERAEELCGSSDFEITSQVSNEGSSHVGTNDWSSEGSEISRSMVVVCRSPAAN